MSYPTHLRRPRFTLGLVALSSALVLGACSAPGGSTAADTTADAATTSAAGAASSSATGASDTPSAGSGSSGAPSSGSTSAPSTAGPTCGTDPVTLKAYLETGFPLPKNLSDEFTKQYPNVTFEIREDQFAVITQNAARVLQDDAPDLIRVPQLSELAKDGLVLGLDDYAKSYGWDKWPASQLEQLRLDSSNQRGSGTLYAMGLNFSLTGVFYNKELAAKAGMTTPPTTLAEFDTVLQQAKDAGLVPIDQFNGGATGGLAFPLQNLMASYGETAPINDWIFQKQGATIDTDSNLKATQHLEKWLKAGYFDPDINSQDYAAMMSKFIGGDALFIFDGDWESGNLDKQMAGNVGFFLMPSATAGGKQGAMSAPLTYAIPAKAAHADCAAFFLNWVVTNKEARTITVNVGGSHPMGPADAFMPEVKAGTVTAATLEAGAKVVADNGSMDFIANATGSIYAKSWTPELQRLAAGQETPEALLKKVQSDYESQTTG